MFAIAYFVATTTCLTGANSLKREASFRAATTSVSPENAVSINTSEITDTFAPTGQKNNKSKPIGK